MMGHLPFILFALLGFGLLALALVLMLAAFQIALLDVARRLDEFRERAELAKNREAVLRVRDELDAFAQTPWCGLAFSDVRVRQLRSHLTGLALFLAPAGG